MKKNILIGITGGIAAYKIPFLIRLLKKNDYEVKIILTANAKKLVSEYTLEVLSGNKVFSEIFNDEKSYNIDHISLSKWADQFIIAPATANIIAKLATGIADNLLTSVFLATNAIKSICPAMNSNMYNNPITQKNINTLSKFGVNIIGPESGFLACGDEGKGRMVEIEDIFQKIEFNVTEPILKGKKIIISAGPTQEYIDDVRFITNPSSGKMGYALAEVARNMHGEVTLISGPVNISPPRDVNTIHVISAKEMYKNILSKKADIYIMCAAVCDILPAHSDGKLDKYSFPNEINISKNKDIISDIKKKYPNSNVIGFSAEYGFNIERAKQKMERKNIDAIVLNDISRKDIGFSSDMNEVLIIKKDGKKIKIELNHKKFIAKQILKNVC